MELEQPSWSPPTKLLALTPTALMDSCRIRLGLKVAVGKRFVSRWRKSTPYHRRTARGRCSILRMEGKTVFKWAIRTVEDACRDVLLEPKSLRGCGPIHLSSSQYPYLDAVTQNLSLDPSRVCIQVDRVGNTSAASIPLALHACVQEGKLTRGDLYSFVGSERGSLGAQAYFAGSAIERSQYSHLRVSPDRWCNLRETEVPSSGTSVDC